MSNLNKLIEERRAKTGESYATARRFVTGAHRKHGGGSEPPDDRKVYAREDVLRCAKVAPDRTVAVLGRIHQEEAHISYERTPSAQSLNTPTRAVRREFVTMTAIMADGAPAWQFSGRIDALWGGPEPEDLAQLAKWLREDVHANALTVHSFKGNVADITAHWLAKEPTGDRAAFEAVSEELMGDDSDAEPSEVQPVRGRLNRSGSLLAFELANKMARPKSPFDGIKSPLDGIKSPLDGIKSPFDGIKSPLDGIKSPFDGIKSPFDGIKSPLDAAKFALPAALRSQLAFFDRLKLPKL
jgi:hypothetical protein